MKELSISKRTMPVLLQALVHLRNDGSHNKWFEKEHMKQLLHRWLHISVEIDVSFCLASSFKAVKAVEKSVFSIWVDLLLCRSIQLLVLS